MLSCWIFVVVMGVCNGRSRRVFRVENGAVLELKFMTIYRGKGYVQGDFVLVPGKGSGGFVVVVVVISSISVAPTTTIITILSSSSPPPPPCQYHHHHPSRLPVSSPLTGTSVLCDPGSTLSALGVVFLHPIPRVPDIKAFWNIGGHVREPIQSAMIHNEIHEYW
jgi:hypothetical protein